MTDLSAVPDDLIERDQWVLWRYEGRSKGGKPTKVPYQASHLRADTTDPLTWTTFELASSLHAEYAEHYSGIGFVFSKDDPFVGIDLDQCLDTDGDVAAWARQIVERFAHSYMETSPSGRGIKIWVRGALPANMPGKRIGTGGDGSIEMYDRGRYFAVTGHVFRDAPQHIEDHAADVMLLYNRLTAGGNGWPVGPQQGRIPFGTQHNTLVSICGTLRARQVCEEAIEACLQVVRERQCEKPPSPEHVHQIVVSSRKWGKGRQA